MRKRRRTNRSDKLWRIAAMAASSFWERLCENLSRADGLDEADFWSSLTDEEDISMLCFAKRGTMGEETFLFEKIPVCGGLLVGVGWRF